MRGYGLVRALAAVSGRVGVWWMRLHIDTSARASSSKVVGVGESSAHVDRLVCICGHTLQGRGGYPHVRRASD